jgi:hypothetical protein
MIVIQITSGVVHGAVISDRGVVPVIRHVARTHEPPRRVQERAEHGIHTQRITGDLAVSELRGAPHKIRVEPRVNPGGRINALLGGDPLLLGQRCLIPRPILLNLAERPAPRLGYRPQGLGDVRVVRVVAVLPERLHRCLQFIGVRTLDFLVDQR